MSKIYLHPNKHIGIVFRPRSGSHILRGFISEVSNRFDLLEWFNYSVNTSDVRVVGNNILYRYRGDTSSATAKQLKQRSLSNLTILDKLSGIGVYSVFGILPHSYMHEFPELSTLIANHKDTQFLRLERADVLYSVLSIEVARKSGIWHHVPSEGLQKKQIDPFSIPLNVIHQHLMDYIHEQDEINKEFGGAPIIYYEQFQHSIGTIREIFDGIPKKIISLPFERSGNNYKSLILNIDEIDDHYEMFVNKHQEHFPQYFNKLPHIKIPASQGRQPRDLSLNTSEETVS